MGVVYFRGVETRGTITCWIRSSNGGNRYRKYYHYVQRLGHFDEVLQCAYERRLVAEMRGVLHNETVVRLALSA